MDFNVSKYIEKEELLPFLQNICKNEKIKDCSQWQVEYILSLIDLNHDGRLDFEEIAKNYSVILRELKKYNKVRSSYTVIDFFND